MANEQGLNGNDFKNDPIGAAGKFNALLRKSRMLNTISAFIQTLLDDPDAATARGTLEIPTSDNAFTTGQTISGSGVTTLLTINGSNDGATIGPLFKFRRTSTSPAANDGLAILQFEGMDSAGNATEYAGLTSTIEDPTNGGGGEFGRLAVRTIQGGTVATRLRISAGAYTPNATGGDKGIDTINASAVYDDNVLLTDYVFDHAVDGKADARKYGVVAEHFDPSFLDIDTMTAYWREHRHFPNLPGQDTWTEATRPSTGKLAQALLEIVEVQAVHIARLNERLRRIESMT